MKDLIAKILSAEGLLIDSAIDETDEEYFNNLEKHALNDLLNAVDQLSKVKAVQFINKLL